MNSRGNKAAANLCPKGNRSQTKLYSCVDVTLPTESHYTTIQISLHTMNLRLLCSNFAEMLKAQSALSCKHNQYRQVVNQLLECVDQKLSAIRHCT